MTTIKSRPAGKGSKKHATVEEEIRDRQVRADSLYERVGSAWIYHYAKDVRLLLNEVERLRDAALKAEYEEGEE